MTTTPNHEPLSLERAEDVLAYIPHALGFHPNNSVVLLLMVEQKLEATLRVDLPSHDDHAAEADQWIAQVCDLISRLPGLTCAVGVVYQPDVESCPAGLPWMKLLSMLTEELEHRGTPLRQAWCHSEGRVWDYASRSPNRDRIDAMHPELNPTSLRMVVAGSAPLSEPWDGQGVAPWAEAAEIRQLAQNLDGDFLDSLDVWASIVGMQPFEAELLLRKDPMIPARLLGGLQSRLVRDMLPYLAGAGTVEAAQAVEILRYQRGGAPVQVSGLADFLLGRGDQYPQWDRIEHLWFICRDLLGVAQGEHRAALLCLLAWIEWAKGRGSMAMALLKGALKIVPDYRLARLLDQLLRRGIMPQWATDPQRAWRATFE